MALTENNPVKAHLTALYETFNLLIIIDDLRMHKVEKINAKKHALYRAGLVHLCATWETFLETAIKNSLSFIEKKTISSKQIPLNVLLEISNRLKNQKDNRNIWNISDQGWKKELNLNFALLKEGFNTARPSKVDEFIFKTIGLKNLSHHWKWKGQSFQQSVHKLNRFMDLRGKITHRIVSDQKIQEHILIDYINFVFHISILSANVIRNHVHSITKEYPWELNVYKKIV